MLDPVSEGGPLVGSPVRLLHATYNLPPGVMENKGNVDCIVERAVGVGTCNDRVLVRQREEAMSSIGKIPSSLLHWEMQQGQYGIGACVSTFARQHGEEVRTQHGAASLEHERNHPGPPAHRHEASPAACQ